MSDPTLNQDEIDALLADVADPTEGPIDAAPVSDAGFDASTDMGAFDVGMDDGMHGGDAVQHSDTAAYNEPAAAAAAPQPAIQIGPVSTKNIEVLLDIPLDVVVELGRTDMPIQKILELGPGSVVELNRLAGEPISVMVNGKLVARGEVVVVDENFGVKITSIISPIERLTQLH